MIRVAIGARKDENGHLIPVGIYTDGSVRDVELKDLNIEEVKKFNNIAKKATKN